LKIKLQLPQFETDFQEAEFAKVQELSDLRTSLGYKSVPADYDVADPFDHQPVKANIDDLQMKALQNRPDLRAGPQGIVAANSPRKAIGKQDVTSAANYSHVNSIKAAACAMSVPLPISNRNQVEIARTGHAIRQAQEQGKGTREQVLADVDGAYEGLRERDNVVVSHRSTYLGVAQEDRDSSEHAYHGRGASSLDFQDAERSSQSAYRQALASYAAGLGAVPRSGWYAELAMTAVRAAKVVCCLQALGLMVTMGSRPGISLVTHRRRWRCALGEATSTKFREPRKESNA
jgi:outer membrane protein TolC